MNSDNKFSWRARARSFKYAFHGIWALLRDEHNARIHLVAAILAVLLGVILHISVLQWCIIILCIGLVFAAECINSAIEAIADKVSPCHDPLVGKAKDVAAAAVLLLAIAALAVGIVIFVPAICRFFAA